MPIQFWEYQRYKYIEHLIRRRLSVENSLLTVLPDIRPAGIIFSFDFYSKVTVHKAKGHSKYIDVRVLFEGEGLI